MTAAASSSAAGAAAQAAEAALVRARAAAARAAAQKISTVPQSEPIIYKLYWRKIQNVTSVKKNKTDKLFTTLDFQPNVQLYNPVRVRLKRPQSLPSIISTGSFSG